MNSSSQLEMFEIENEISNLSSVGRVAFQAKFNAINNVRIRQSVNQDVVGILNAAAAASVNARINQYAEGINIEFASHEISVKHNGQKLNSISSILASTGVETSPGGFVDNAAALPAANYFGSRSFIGYPLMAIMSQNVAIDRVLRIPTRDATAKPLKFHYRNGKIDPRVVDLIERAARRQSLNSKLAEAAWRTRAFGICNVIHHTDQQVTDRQNPQEQLRRERESRLNPSEIRPGSYRGISMTDPYYVAPIAGGDDFGRPGAIGFYEPQKYVVAGLGIFDKSHMTVLRNTYLPDLLKPQYLWGGISLTQLIFEAVYMAFKAEIESMALMLKKRLRTYSMPMGKIRDPGMLAEIQANEAMADNFSLYIVPQTVQGGEVIKQIDTALSDVTQLVSAKWQLAAALGDYHAPLFMALGQTGMQTDEDSVQRRNYPMLKSIQEHLIRPVAEDWLRLEWYSTIADAAAKLKIKDFDRDNIPDIDFESLENLSTTQRMDYQTKRSAQVQQLVDGGLLSQLEARRTLRNDPLLKSIWNRRNSTMRISRLTNLKLNRRPQSFGEMLTLTKETRAKRRLEIEVARNQKPKLAVGKAIQPNPSVMAGLNLSNEKFLNKFFDKAIGLVTGQSVTASFLLGSLKKLADDWREKNQGAIESNSHRWSKEVDNAHRRSFDRSTESFGKLLPIDLKRAGESTQKYIAEAANRAANLVVTLPAEAVEELERQIRDGVLGENDLGTDTIKKWLSNQKTLTARHAQLLGYDQTRKVYEDLNQSRFREAGIEYYKWQANGGSRDPRPHHHKVLNGKIFALSNPPIADARSGERAAPGVLIYCRCTMIPILPFDKIAKSNDDWFGTHYSFMQNDPDKKINARF